MRDVAQWQVEFLDREAAGLVEADERPPASTKVFSASTPASTETADVLWRHDAGRMPVAISCSAGAAWQDDRVVPVRAGCPRVPPRR